MTARAKAISGFIGMVLCTAGLVSIFALELSGHTYVSVVLAGLLGILLGWSWLVWSEGRARQRELAYFARWMSQQGQHQAHITVLRPERPVA